MMATRVSCSTASSSRRARAWQYLRSVAIASALLVLAGCVSVPPARIIADRADYGQVIADSWKRQMLLNVVRMRYGDAPAFLDVTSVINTNSVMSKGVAQLQLPGGANPNVLALGAEGTWSNTPTLTYQPLVGDRFTRSMLQPIPPAAVFQLLQAGWPVGVVLRAVVSSINGLRNDSAGAVGDPGFRQLVDALARIQRTAGLALRVEARKDGSSILMVLREGAADTGLREDGRRVRELLGVEGDANELEIVFGLLPRNPREVAVISRSMLEMLLQLGFGIDVPAEDVTATRVLPGLQQADGSQAAPIVHIRSGVTEPADPYAAVSYRGHWFWIDQVDIASKRAFTFLLILSSLAETGQGVAAPVVTVPSR